MQLVEINKNRLREFLQFVRVVYKNNPWYRHSQERLTRQYLGEQSVFQEHTRTRLFFIYDQGKVAGRFALIVDQKLPDCVQLAFFEALEGLKQPVEAITSLAAELFPSCSRLVAGLNGHLNHQAGILLDHYHEPPLFRRPYAPPWYAGYFSAFTPREILSFRFSVAPFQEYFRNAENSVWNGITTRFMRKRAFRHELARYTRLNNACFRDYPYRTERTEEQDYRLFKPLKPFLDNENLIFAEYEGRPVGYLLWYPDLNERLRVWQLPGPLAAVNFRCIRKPDTFHFSEVAVLPRYQISMASYALIFKMAVVAKKYGYKQGETSFIFKEDTKSLNLAVKYLQRAFGIKIEPYRTFALFEIPLPPRQAAEEKSRQ